MTRMTNIILPYDGNSVPIPDGYSEMTTKMTYNASGLMTYLGKAPTGSLSASAVWQIKKLEYDAADNMSSVTFANGTITFDKVWDSCTTYTYS